MSYPQAGKREVEVKAQAKAKARTSILIVIFLLTSLVGVWAAYDREAAWYRFGSIGWGLVLAMGVVLAGQWGGQRGLGLTALGCALLAGGIGAYFLLDFDWATRGSGKFAVLQQAGLWVQAHRPAIRLPEDIHPNVAGGGLALTLPLGVGGVAWAWTQRRWPAVAVGASALLLALAALVLTASRGAWLGLGAGLLAAGYLAWRAGSAAAPALRWFGDVLLVAAVLVVLGGFWAAITWPGMAQLLGAVSVGQSTISRVALWRDALALVGDYPFTGSGLGAGSTMMAYSSYVLLLPVGAVVHVHNLFLQIAVEQGLPGLGVFLGLVGAAGWNLVTSYRQDGSGHVFRLAATAALVALLVHGMVDAGTYVSRMVLVVFLPLGFTWALILEQEVRNQAPSSLLPVRRTRWTPILWRLAFILVLAVLLLPGPRAAFQANLGAVAQTRAELSVYRWPEWPIQDAVRRSPDVDLAPAIAYYQAALALNAANVTANRRLGQIALSLGQYQAARQRLEAAYAAAPAQRATRQLLGESYAVEGESERAAALWQTVDVSQGQLTLRQWWYDHLGEPQRGAWMAQAAALAVRE